jgi:protocatechuate 3,4-dioxygenase beta subunit
MPADNQTTRRGFLVTAAGATSLVAAGDAFGQQNLAPTPACDDGHGPTLRQTEGPYFKPRSPGRGNLREPGMAGRLVELTGFVLTRACRPVARALVDLWHADDKGDYDNAGFKLRGHVFTDAEGRYRFATIVPGVYPGRTRHFHVKVQAPNGPVLTTQLYFPGDAAANQRDGLFRRELLTKVADEAGGLAARFDVVLDIR